MILKTLIKVFLGNILILFNIFDGLKFLSKKFLINFRNFRMFLKEITFFQNFLFLHFLILIKKSAIKKIEFHEPIELIQP